MRTLTVLWLLAMLSPVVGWGAATSVLFVIDGSGSMWGRVGGKPKIEIARSVMGDMIRKLPQDIQTGLMSYGHNRKDDCSDIQIVAPLGSGKESVIQALNDIQPKGKTPLAAAVKAAAAQLRQQEGTASVVLISDGKESCDGDPCAAAREVASTGVNLRVHVIGFDVTPEETDQLTCIAEEGKGKYFTAANSEQLVAALTAVQEEVVKPAPKPVSDVIFEDQFDRDSLGEMWELQNPDPARFALTDGKAVSVATEPEANRAILRQPISGDFVVTTKVTMELGWRNVISIYAFADEKNYVALQIVGGEGGAKKIVPHFTKYIGDQVNDINSYYDLKSVGDRDLKEAFGQSMVWFLQIERKGFKYIGRVSADGAEWTKIGTHTLIHKGDVRVGYGARSGGKTENVAEFDSFVVIRSE